MIFLKETHGGIIIAGGIGRRLMPLTAGIPKPLLTVNGKSPLERSLLALTDANINNIAITTGFLGEKVESFVSDLNYNFSQSTKNSDINIKFYKEETPMGTSGMIFKILPSLDETFIVLSGDIVFGFSLKDMLEFHQKKNAAVTIASVKTIDPTEYGTIISKDGIITSFREKPSWKQVISTKINTGIYIINRKVLEKCPYEFKDFASELFPYLMSQGETLACFETDDYWCDMGTPESYHKCNMYFSKGENVIGDYISVSKDSQISNSVIMNGVKIGENTKIISSVIGEGVSIGKNCTIENGIIGNRALVCDNAVVKKGGYVYEDAIVGKGKTVIPEEKEAQLFSDSGQVELSLKNTKKTLFLGKGLAKTSGERPILLFFDGSEKANKITSLINNAILINKGNGLNCGESFYSIAAFSAMKNNSLSVFIEFSPQTDVITATIFDENGLTLSREEQITCEKVSAVTDKELASTMDFNPQNPIFEKDFSNIYVLEKSSLFENLSGINVVLENSAPCRLLSRIIKKLKGNCIVANSPKDYEGISDCFFINERGTDVYCITKSKVKIPKSALLSIAAVYCPNQNVTIPEHFKGRLSRLIEENNGSCNIFTDSKKGRKKANGFYNFDDGISISLAVLLACSRQNMSIDELIQTVPKIFFAEKTVLFQGNKGIMAEKLSTNSHSDNEKIKSENGFSLIIPQYRNAFKIFAEATSAEFADELLTKAETDILNFSHESDVEN